MWTVSLKNEPCHRAEDQQRNEVMFSLEPYCNDLSLLGGLHTRWKTCPLFFAVMLTYIFICT